VHENLQICLDALKDSRLFAVETTGRRSYSDIAYRDGDAFLFGPETRGLPPTALQQAGADRCLFIPMRAQSRSINLSNAVAIVVFEAWRQIGFAGAPELGAGD
jgi:tRNA (cytidine/uridine-2'-O-)-methyltransferase